MASKHMTGTAPTLIRSGKYLNDQFAYKVSLSDDKRLLALQAGFGNTFGFVVFGSTKPGLLENHLHNQQDQEYITKQFWDQRWNRYADAAWSVALWALVPCAA